MNTSSTKLILTDLSVAVVGILVAIGIFLLVQPETDHKIDYSSQISDLQFKISELEKTEELPLLTDSWVRAHMLASFFGANIRHDEKEALNGGISTNQPAFFGRLNAPKPLQALSAAWLIEQTLPATVQTVHITETDTTISIAVLGKEK